MDMEQERLRDGTTVAQVFNEVEAEPQRAARVQAPEPECDKVSAEAEFGAQHSL